MPAVVGLLTVHLHIAGARSLKEKRMVIKRLKDRLKKLNVAIAETEHQDAWQRAELSIVTVSNDGVVVDRALAAVCSEIERLEPGLITGTHVELLH